MNEDFHSHSNRFEKTLKILSLLFHSITLLIDSNSDRLNSVQQMMILR